MGPPRRSFFKRTREPEGESGTVVEAPEGTGAVDESLPVSAEEPAGVAPPVAAREGNGAVAAPEEDPAEEPAIDEPLAEPDKPAEVELARAEAAEEEETGGWFG